MIYTPRWHICTMLEALRMDTSGMNDLQRKGISELVVEVFYGLDDKSRKWVRVVHSMCSAVTVAVATCVTDSKN